LKLNRGAIKAGALADLVLLTKNPLDRVEHARMPLGLAVRGRWLDSFEPARLRDDSRP